MPRLAQGRHPYLSGNFAPVQRTRDLTPCTFSGSIPPDLVGGQYVRNGGNPLANEDLGRAAHWFDGDGMLSGVLFRRVGDRVQPEFVNRFLITDVYGYASRAKGLRRPVLPSIATLVDPVATTLAVVCAVFRTMLLVILSRIATGGSRWPIRKISAANTGVVYHDGRALATCESGPPLRFALPSLETIGWFDGRAAENEICQEDEWRDGSMKEKEEEGEGTCFGGESMLSFMREWTTAHPKVDQETGEMIAFHSVFLKPFVYYSIVAPGSKRRHNRDSRFNVAIPGVTAPKMMHDFGVSHRHTVIMDLPLELDPTNLVKGQPVLNYNPDSISRFGVFPRYQPEAVRWFETGACCVFHTANCWDTTKKTSSGLEVTLVNLLVCRLTSAAMIFTAGNLPPPPRPLPRVGDSGTINANADVEEQCRLYYYAFSMSISPSSPPSISQQFALSAIPFEFPTLSQQHAMGPARFVYGCTSSTLDTFTAALGKAAKVNVLAKIDVRTLIGRGPPGNDENCVDSRTVAEVLRSLDPADPIQLYQLPAGHYAQEPRFVARRHTSAEDDGWLLTYVFDEAQLDANGDCSESAISELWIIDAAGMRDVIAKIKLPQRVPYGLHGTWFSEEEIQAQRDFERLRDKDTDESHGIWDDVLCMIERWLG